MTQYERTLYEGFYELFQQQKTADEVWNEMMKSVVLDRLFCYGLNIELIEDAANKVASERGFAMRVTHNDKGEFEIRKVTRHDKVRRDARYSAQ